MLRNHFCLLVQSFPNPVTDFYDIYLTQGYRDCFAKEHNSERWRNHIIPLLVPEPIDDQSDEFPIKSLDGVVLVTVLSSGRIEGAISNYDTTLMSKVTSIFDLKEVKWIFVGVDNESLITNKHKALLDLRNQGRLIFIKYIHNLRKFLRHCDIYVQLPHLNGGGTGMAMAAAESKPILIFKDSDARNILTEDVVFGYDEIDAFIATIKSLVRNEGYRRALGLKLRERLAENHPDLAASNLLKHVEDAIASYIKRKTELP